MAKRDMIYFAGSSVYELLGILDGASARLLFQAPTHLITGAASWREVSKPVWELLNPVSKQKAP